MKKILVIDSSELLRQYLKEKLEEYGFTVITAKDGFEGMIRLKNELPDLVITDFYLSRMTGIEFLKEKHEYRSTTDIPLIILSSRVDRDLLARIARYKVFKFLAKPIKIDLLIQSISELFKMKIDIDRTPSIIDVHLNDDILFIEIASGLNSEKINILKYKILQIKEVYKTEIKKILIIFSDIDFSEKLGFLLDLLLSKILDCTKATVSSVKILTNSEAIPTFLNVHPQYKGIQITNDFVEAIDSLGKIDIFAFGEEIENIKKDIITIKETQKVEGPFLLKFDNEKIRLKLENRKNGKYVIAIVDDDFSILEFMATVLSFQEAYEIHTYENGRFFVNDLENNPPDLIFLDLMMPEMNGFQVMKYLNDNNIDIPIIVVTALIQKDMILRAQKFGVKSYISKPLRMEVITKKAEEILKSNF